MGTGMCSILCPRREAEPVNGRVRREGAKGLACYVSSSRVEAPWRELRFFLLLPSVLSWRLLSTLKTFANETLLPFSVGDQVVIRCLRDGPPGAGDFVLHG